MNKQASVICCFPGVGALEFEKKYRYKRNTNKAIKGHLRILNMMGMFEDGKRYVDFLEGLLNGGPDIILSDTQLKVLDILNERKIEHYIVYPSIELKEEYIRRYISNGNSFQHIQHMQKAWYTGIRSIEERIREDFTTLIPLHEGEYLTDIFKNANLNNWRV